MARKMKIFAWDFHGTLEQGVDAKNIIVVGDRPGDVNAGLLIGAKTYQYVNPYNPNIKTAAHYKISDLRKILTEI